MSGCVLSTDAALDLDDIWEYIAADSIDAADRWIGKLFDAFEALSQNPGIGHKREDLTAYPVLFWPVGSYLVIYRAERLPIHMFSRTNTNPWDVAKALTARGRSLGLPCSGRPR
jgi:plasmid stabilization system protein ParE